MKLQLPLTMLLSLSLLAACNKNDNDKSVNKEESVEVSISQNLDKATEEARNEIINGNISLGDADGKAKKAEITPKGDLLIDGKPVSITAEQRALLVTHRQLLANIAINGMEIGMQAAKLATTAAGEAIKSIFTGDTDQVEKKVEGETNKIEASATALCEQLPLLMESQKTLADSLPEFKPYATMTAKDIDDCHGEVHERK